jgi:hypothetical protein
MLSGETKETLKEESMKSTVTLLALSASTALLGDCCSPCEPCCVPQPRPPICCECYVPSYYDMQCDWGLFFSADFLYWYADETDLSYAVVEKTVDRSTVTTPATATTPSHFKHLGNKWAPGFRIGLGWEMDGGWDLYANWTWYKNNKKNHVSASEITTQFPGVGGSSILLPWIDPAAMNFTAALFDSAHAKWHMLFNQVDLELGRRYWLSKCFTLRPYTGLRGAWTHTNLSISGKDDHTIDAVAAVGLPAGSYSLSTSDKFRNRNWGVGMIGGIQPTFFFTDEFSLFGNAELAVLWGQFNNRVKRHYTSTFNGASDMDLSASSRDNFTGIQPVLDVAIGLRWETCWCENRYRFNLDAGWEHHVFFDYNYRVKLLDPVIQTTAVAGNTGRLSGSITEEHTNLGMGGFVLRARFDF